MRRGLLTVGGGLVGTVAGAWLTHTEPQASSPTEHVAPCAESSLLVPDSLAEDQLTELLRLRALRYRLEGSAAEWPQDLPAELEPEAMGAELAQAAEALAAEGVALLTVDCAEYPCIGLFRAPAPERSSATTNAWSLRLREALPELETFGHTSSSWRLHGEGSSAQVTALAFWISPASPELAERVGTRLRRHRILGVEGVRSQP